MQPKNKAPELTSITIAVVILLITVGTVAIGFLLFQQLDESSKQVGAIKIRKEFAPDPLVEGVQFIEKKNSMSTDHPLCEKLLRQAQQLEQSKDFRGAAAAYDASAKQYLKDVSPRALDSSDKLHLAVRYRSVAVCLSQTNDFRGALKFAKLAAEFHPNERNFELLATIYDSLRMPAEAKEARKYIDTQPTKSELMQHALDLLK